MAKAAANLSVSLTARTKKFSKKMRDARKTIKKFGLAVRSVAIKLVKFGAALTGAAAIGLSIMVKQSFKTIDVIAKLSDRIGATTESIIALGHAAEITGAGTEALQKGLEQLSKRLGEVKISAAGSGEAKDAILALGLNIDEMLKLSPTEAFVLLAEKIKVVGTEAEKAAIAYKLFGRTGLKLKNTLDLGAEGLQIMADEAARLGLMFSRIDALKVEQANDAMTRLKASAVGFANAIAIHVAPHVEQLADFLTELKTTGVRNIAGLTEEMVNFGRVITNIPLMLANVQLAIGNLLEPHFRMRRLIGAGLGVNLGGFNVLKDDATQRIEELLREMEKNIISPSAAARFKRPTLGTGIGMGGTGVGAAGALSTSALTISSFASSRFARVQGASQANPVHVRDVVAAQGIEELLRKIDAFQRGGGTRF